jgi:hypothetical protein
MTFLHLWIVLMVFKSMYVNHTNHHFLHFDMSSAIYVLKSLSDRFLTVPVIFNDFQFIQVEALMGLFQRLLHDCIFIQMMNFGVLALSC